MSERYDAAVEKENKEWTSLIASTVTPVTKKKRKPEQDSADEDNSDSEEEEVIVEKPKKQKGKKRKLEVKAPPKVDEAVMKMEDMVAEGVDWSDDEE